MMARRTGAQQTGRKSTERSRVGKQKTKPRKTPRTATPRPKRAAVSAADGAEVIRTIRESSVERTGQSASRDETRVLGAPTGGPPVGPQLGDITIDAEQAEVETGASCRASGSPMNDSSKPLSTCGPTRPEPTQRARGG